MPDLLSRISAYCKVRSTRGTAAPLGGWALGTHSDNANRTIFSAPSPQGPPTYVPPGHAVPL